MEPHQSLAALTPAATLGQIASIDRQAGQLLAFIGLNPEDYEDETLQSVCKQKQWSEVEVLRWVKKNSRLQDGQTKGAEPNDSEQSENPNFGEDLSSWCGWLEEGPMAKTIHLLDEVSNDFPRAHQIHGNQYPWLKDMQWHFEQFQETLRVYTRFEKKRFYPIVKKLDSQQEGMLAGSVSDLKRGLSIIKGDQKKLQQGMSIIRKKAHNFENPPGACSTLCILNQNFKMLDASLRQQFSIESAHIIPLVQKKLKIK